MADLGACIAAVLFERARGRRLKVGVLGRTGAATVAAIAAQGHRTLVMSDRFRFLHALSKRIGTGAGGSFALLEVDASNLPVARRSLDALVLAGGMIDTASLADTLVALGRLLVPGGLLVWPALTSSGARFGLGRLVGPFRGGRLGPMPRERLSEAMMAAGYCEVGQRPSSGTGVARWVTTTGVKGMCGW